MRAVLTVLAFIFILNVNAQKRNYQDTKQQFTPEQIAELRTKKTELNFDLNDKQRQELYALNLTITQKRVQNRAEMKARRAENKMLTTDERYQKQLQFLDNQKKHQTEMKRILGDKQYSEWKEIYRNQQINRQSSMQNKRFAFHQKRNSCKLN